MTDNQELLNTQAIRRDVAARLYRLAFWTAGVTVLGAVAYAVVTSNVVQRLLAALWATGLELAGHMSLQFAIMLLLGWGAFSAFWWMHTALRGLEELKRSDSAKGALTPSAIERLRHVSLLIAGGFWVLFAVDWVGWQADNFSQLALSEGIGAVLGMLVFSFPCVLLCAGFLLTGVSRFFCARVLANLTPDQKKEMGTALAEQMIFPGGRVAEMADWLFPPRSGSLKA